MRMLLVLESMTKYLSLGELCKIRECDIKQNKNSKMDEIKKFCDGISGKWTQTGSENMDAINIGSNMGWAKRQVANMMTVRLQVTAPNPTEVFMSFQTKLKNMDLQLKYSGVTDHLGLNDEPVKSTLAMDSGNLVLSTSGMDYGTKVRVFEHIKDPEEQLIITEKLVEAGIVGKRFMKRE